MRKCFPYPSSQQHRNQLIPQNLLIVCKPRECVKKVIIMVALFQSLLWGHENHSLDIWRQEIIDDFEMSVEFRFWEKVM